MKIIISTAVHLLLSSYALSTENEEVAAVLIGNIHNEIATIETILLTTRKDKRKDRVEISSEQLSLALDHAEKLGMRVIGWMHSHPKITVQPSKVDITTQYQLQSLDSSFFGLIYACFYEKNYSHRTQLLAFQSIDTIDGGLDFTKIPIEIVASPKGRKNEREFQMLKEIPSIFYQEIKSEQQSAIEYTANALRILKIQHDLIDSIMRHIS